MSGSIAMTCDINFSDLSKSFSDCCVIKAYHSDEFFWKFANTLNLWVLSMFFWNSYTQVLITS